jgi:hypothetical protein
MGEYFEVPNVTEAIALAEKFKREKRYDWFRGQTEDWPLISSLVRLDDKAQNDAVAMLGRFASWIKSTPGLEDIAPNQDAIKAIAQHHGIPTNFIDFTLEPRVAGFFASENPSNDPEEMPNCILCLDTHELEEHGRFFTWEGIPPPEFLKLDVPNLWRLEAQSGVFLFCPYTNLESRFHLDRIIFPYTGQLSLPSHDDIYPKRKSSLEILLDQFFMLERLMKGSNWIRNSVSAKVLTIEEKDEKWSHDIIKIEPPLLPSWSPELIKKWIYTPSEKIAVASTDIEIVIDLNISQSPTSNFKYMFQQIQQKISSLSDPKEKLINWRINANSLDQLSKDYLEKSIKRTWDGLRILPYDLSDIFIGLSNCVVIGVLLRTISKPDGYRLWMECANLRFGKSIEVAFGANDDSYGRGYVSQASLLSCIRDDFISFVTPKFQGQIDGNIYRILQVIQAPDRLFDFNKLVKIFAQAIVPTQILIREGEAIFFSPARLTSFGLP